MSASRFSTVVIRLLHRERSVRRVRLSRFSIFSMLLNDRSSHCNERKNKSTGLICQPTANRRNSTQRRVSEQKQSVPCTHLERNKMAKVLDLLDNVVVQLELDKRVETEQVIDPKYVFERKQQDLNVLEVDLFARFFSSRLACRAQFTPAVQLQLKAQAKLSGA